jgi:hypothetical protein
MTPFFDKSGTEEDHNNSDYEDAQTVTHFSPQFLYFSLRFLLYKV